MENVEIFGCATFKFFFAVTLKSLSLSSFHLEHLSNSFHSPPKVILPAFCGTKLFSLNFESKLYCLSTLCLKLIKDFVSQGFLDFLVSCERYVFAPLCSLF